MWQMPLLAELKNVADRCYKQAAPTELRAKASFSNVLLALTLKDLWLN